MELWLGCQHPVPVIHHLVHVERREVRAHHARPVQVLLELRVDAQQRVVEPVEPLEAAQVLFVLDQCGLRLRPTLQAVVEAVRQSLQQLGRWLAAPLRPWWVKLRRLVRQLRRPQRPDRPW